MTITHEPLIYNRPIKLTKFNRSRAVCIAITLLITLLAFCIFIWFYPTPLTTMKTHPSNAVIPFVYVTFAGFEGFRGLRVLNISLLGVLFLCTTFWLGPTTINYRTSISAIDRGD